MRNGVIYPCDLEKVEQSLKISERDRKNKEEVLQRLGEPYLDPRLAKILKAMLRAHNRCKGQKIVKARAKLEQLRHDLQVMEDTIGTETKQVSRRNSPPKRIIDVVGCSTEEDPNVYHANTCMKREPQEFMSSEVSDSPPISDMNECHDDSTYRYVEPY